MEGALVAALFLDWYFAVNNHFRENYLAQLAIKARYFLAA
ncbi:hypothetical Protein YC6258_04830 [Gynuella sunshinyii YC6258]|uniref:Uncharacterized protein n=1 Tax=Gynuella sunshinyii YC6258 TaxID=1445510 RepID=A0A0C5VQJ8_9GAMM|nr:hypothetical Protein YC6258_04830 [Gynuella sunshinyii YC6258]